MTSRGPRGHREGLAAGAMLLPYLAAFLLFRFGPVLAGLAASFTRWNIIGTPRYVGLQNYARLFHDPIFTTAVANTLYFVVLAAPPLVALGLILALLVDQPLRGRTVARTAIFAPYVVMSAVVGVVWLWMYDTHYGLINYYLGTLRRLGLGPVPWLSDPGAAMPALAVAQIWWIVGFNMIIVLAGLQEIPDELRAAARVDGATEWGVLRRVTLPLLTPTLLVVTMLTLIQTIQAFDLIYVTTRGGPSLATVTIVYYLYTAAFQNFQLGYGSAAAYVAFCILLVLGLAQAGLQRALAR